MTPFPPEEPLRLEQHLPGAHIQGYPTAGPNAHIPLPEHLLIVARLEAERDAAEREVERMTWAVCHLLLRDGTEKHGGRVANTLLARAVTDGAA